MSMKQQDGNFINISNIFDGNICPGAICKAVMRESTDGQNKNDYKQACDFSGFFSKSHFASKCS